MRGTVQFACLKFALSLGVPPSKISLGIPGYSDWWYPAYDARNGSRMRGSDISFTRAEEILAKNGVKAKWDNVQKSPTASWSDHDGFQQAWDEDARGFIAGYSTVAIAPFPGDNSDPLRARSRTPRAPLQYRHWLREPFPGLSAPALSAGKEWRMF